LTSSKSIDWTPAPLSCASAVVSNSVASASSISGGRPSSGSTAGALRSIRNIQVREATLPTASVAV
jgi:hypothetical protein